MTTADHIETATCLCAAAKTYATSPRYVTEVVVSLSDALHSLEHARARAEADERELAELRALEAELVTVPGRMAVASGRAVAS